jgi:hypothetical protein
VSETQISSHELRILTKAVRMKLHEIVSDQAPVDIETIYEEIGRDPDCAQWRKHYWESSKWGIQSEWKHKIRTYLQARDKGKKLYVFKKGEGWSLVDPNAPSPFDKSKS